MRTAKTARLNMGDLVRYDPSRMGHLDRGAWIGVVVQVVGNLEFRVVRWVHRPDSAGRAGTDSLDVQRALAGVVMPRATLRLYERAL